MTKAQAQTVVDAAVLKPSDLAGYKATTISPDPAQAAGDRAFAQCAGIPVPVYLARDYGRSFSSGSVEIESSADAADSVASARRQLAAFTGASGERCVEQGVRANFAGATSVSVVAHRRPITVAGSDGAFAFAFSASASGAGGRMSASGYLLGSLVGQAEVSVTVIALSGSAPALSQGQRLLTKATARARAAYP